MGEQRDYHEKVSRLPGLPKPLDPNVKDIFDDSIARGSHILNLHLVTAHAPELAAARKPLIQAIRSAGKAERIYREIAITRAAQMVECDYEVHHHKPFCVQCGLSEEAVAALDDWQANRNLFDAKQLALLGFVEEMCGNKGKVSDTVFDEYAKHFSAQEMVELATCASTYYGGGMDKNAFNIMA
ncbi:MAG: carboxymuconolactone decarboxylase family protein, partial [Beijerinckiaceae bacterium]|nr:carboxymuconolactone decarboxylase family protein [Beijerinckiaceae bacterium]